VVHRSQGSSFDNDMSNVEHRFPTAAGQARAAETDRVDTQRGLQRYRKTPPRLSSSEPALFAKLPANNAA